MMQPENQVIIRNIEQLPSGKVLLIDALPDHALKEFSALRPDISWTVYTPYIDTAELLSNISIASQGSLPVHKSAWLTSEQVGLFDAVLIYYPKAKQRFDYYLSMASQLLEQDGQIFIVGEKKGGVKSCDKALKPFSNGTKKLDSARHCMLFTAAFNNHTCKKSMDSWFNDVNLDIDFAGTSINLTLASLPGVFSAKRLDNGTELLLKNMTAVSGKGIDFGCGCGVISAALSLKNDNQIVAIDVDALAVESSNRTFKINGCNATAIHSNGLSNLMNQSNQFDFIASNPPFHTGLQTDYSIVDLFLKSSAKLLKSKYEMWIVANSFLPYQPLFKKYLKAANTVENNKRFSVYHIK